MQASPETIVLPPDLLEEAVRAAERRGIGVNAWVSECVRASLPRPWPPATPDPNDPLFADAAIYEGDGPTDMAERHDDYLYGPIVESGETDAAS
ncbi:hypothetical protein [Alienimonas chondri]|uniref:CopG family transcriptional regulator n=1 Tax=Alienimonas chondri TaxID=2681879 RepID=A0ABX1VHE1_9PLAN|nr:hypothetical protein [Alienimonas chondri]NNJ27258.1 hypothetical protein [Alienimonas chondri]